MGYPYVIELIDNIVYMRYTFMDSRLDSTVVVPTRYKLKRRPRLAFYSVPS